MAKRRRNSAAFNLHNGEYLDTTLRLFEQRIPLDPDFDTRHEGTIFELTRHKAAAFWDVTTSELQATEQSRRLAMAPQRQAKRRALNWVQRLSLKRRAELASISPRINELIKDRVA